MKNSGMTLLEVLVAMTLFSIAALALLKTNAQQTRSTGWLEEKTLANWVAENQMVQLRLEKVWPAVHWTSGTTEMAGRTWYWRWRGIETGQSNTRLLEVEVSLTERKPNGPQSAAQGLLRSYVVKQ